MTNVVKGAGRKRHAATQAKHSQRNPVVGGKRDDDLKAAAEATKTPARKRAAKKAATGSTREAAAEQKRAAAKAPAKKAAAKKVAAKKPTADDGGEPLWHASDTLGANVDRLKTAGVTWRRIAEMATANGIEMPYPDGGKLLRARKQFLAGTEGQPPKRGRTAKKKLDPSGGTDLKSRTQRVEDRLGLRDVPWDSESTDEELLAFVIGKNIAWVNTATASEESRRVPKDGKHTKIGHGENGPYISFASMEGPFCAVSFSKIVSVS